MLTICFLLLKVMICSGILYGYYYIALRNKVFHRWNRFYLLATVVLSLIIPFIKINISQNNFASTPKVFQFLNEVNSRDEFTGSQVIPITLHKNIHIQQFTPAETSQVDYFLLTLLPYACVSLILLSILFQALLKIQKIKHRYPVTIIEGINFRNTDVNGTPFSFFRNIFWNKKIDVQSAIGKQIFQHELIHIREKHSQDKMFINLVLILLWFNPFFWLIKRELNMIHEFIADQGALENGDSDAFAAMVLQAAYPRTQFRITNNFFYSPIKRRLTMLVKKKNPKLSYIGRLLVLPVAAIIFLAFTLRMKTSNSDPLNSLGKIVVVIDAGHGGEDKGISNDGVHEKDITLAIAKKIEELNTNPHIEIILTRAEDNSLSEEARKYITTTQNVDAFISIHADDNTYMNSGISFWITKKDTLMYQSVMLGSNLVQTFIDEKFDLPIGFQVVRTEKPISILNLMHGPAIMIEVGSLSNAKDLQYLIKKENQDQIARNILKSIESYAWGEKLFLDVTPPPRKSESKELVDETSNQLVNVKKKVVDISDINKSLYVENGIELGSGGKIMRSIRWSRVTVYHRLTGNEAIAKYGDRGKDGVIELTTLPPPVIETQPDVYVEFYEAATTPEYPGGVVEWKKHLESFLLQNSKEINKEGRHNRCTLHFLIQKDGTASDVEVLTMSNSKISELIKNKITEIKWKPEFNNGEAISSYKTISVSYNVSVPLFSSGYSLISYQ